MGGGCGGGQGECCWYCQVVWCLLQYVELRGGGNRGWGGGGEFVWQGAKRIVVCGMDQAVAKAGPGMTKWITVTLKTVARQGRSDPG